MISCTFELNGKTTSQLKCGAHSFPAFSGRRGHTNKPSSACIVGVGPIPPGNYYIVDRQTGFAERIFGNSFKENWFALYAVDGEINDEIYCDGERRGEFRLHPNGPQGISAGCITLEKQEDFHTLRAILISAKKRTLKINNQDMRVYGVIRVQ
ncbi:MAG TPA: DUF2778 domain-containing protein [Prosthecobacter sp.]